MLKKILFGIFILMAVAGFYYRNLVSYGWMQAKGQAKILMNVEDVAQVLADPTFPDSLKMRIKLIEEIKKFGVDSLGLTPSDNYTTFYNQHGKPLIWVITASERYRIQAYEWDFPILGTFPYKGFFDSTRADSEAKTLRDAGLDTDIGEVSAWSTLGYLKDPILSSMLNRKEGSLANLILHELTHGTLFVKNNLELNENLASFVGDLGAVRFLTQKYGLESKQLKAYEFSKKYNDAYAQHILRGIRRLDSLYTTFGSDMRADPNKDIMKRNLIFEIVSDADTLFSEKITLKKNHQINEKDLPNNASFTSYKTYRSKQNSFRDEFMKKFNGDFKKYLTYLKRKYPSL
jgi:predicted aminopeptidase